MFYKLLAQNCFTNFCMENALFPACDGHFYDTSFPGVHVSAITNKESRASKLINQDAFQIYRFGSGKIRLVVCDGLGSFAKSDIASKIIVNNFAENFDLKNKDKLLEVLNSSISSFPIPSATCMIAADFVPYENNQGYYCTIISCGDCKALIFDSNDIIFETDEHSESNFLKLKGIAKEYFSDKHVVTKSLINTGKDTDLFIDYESINVYNLRLDNTSSFKVILASDGFWDNVHLSQFLNICSGLKNQPLLSKLYGVATYWMDCGDSLLNTKASFIFDQDKKLLDYIKNDFSNIECDHQAFICEQFEIKSFEDLNSHIFKNCSLDEILKNYQDFVQKPLDGLTFSEDDERVSIYFELFCFRLKLVSQFFNQPSVNSIVDLYLKNCKNFLSSADEELFLDLFDCAIVNYFICFDGFEIIPENGEQTYSMLTLPKSDDITIALFELD